MNLAETRLMPAFKSLLVLVCIAFSWGVSAQTEDQSSQNMLYSQKYKDGINTNATYENQEITYSSFYEFLAPYGQWIADAQYGFVWSPNVDADFKPYYTKGHWALTDYGNTWVSEYQWGWACFHYGRWIFDAYYGWLWVPGQNWGPAWVAWRTGSGCIGWAPLYPGYVYSSGELKQYVCPKDWWIFLPSKYIYSDNYYRYYTGPYGNSNILKHSEFMNNVYENAGVTYFPGPTATQMETITGKPVTRQRLLNSGTPKGAFVHNDLIKMYRPAEIKPTPEGNDKIAPPDYVVATHAVASSGDLVNANSGTPPAFRNDLQGMSHVTASPVLPVNATGKKSDWYDQHRSDKTEYKTNIKSTEINKRGPTGIKRKALDPLPTQGSQTPETVTIPKKKEEEPIKKEQHADPVPKIQDPNAKPVPAPKQKPEPLPPSDK